MVDDYGDEGDGGCLHLNSFQSASHVRMLLP